MDDDERGMKELWEEFILQPVPFAISRYILISLPIWAPSLVLALVLYWKFNP